MRWILIIALLAFWSCNQERGSRIPEVDSSSLIKIELKDKLLFSQFVESVTKVTLEKSSDAPIGDLLRVSKIDDDRFIVLTKAGNEKGLYVFDSDGCFINRIGRQGRGPGEYLTITSYVLDQQQGIVHVYDVGQMAIYLYNLDGLFLEKLSTGLVFEDFTITNTGEYIFYSPIEKTNMNRKVILPRGLYLADKDGKYISTIHGLSGDDNYQFFNRFFFTRSEINSNLLSSFDDKVYCFESNMINMNFEIDFGKHKLPNSNRGGIDIEELTAEYVCAKDMPSESSRYLFFITAMSVSSTAKFCLIDKDALKGYLFDALVNDLSKEAGFFVGSSDNEFYFAVAEPWIKGDYDPDNAFLILNLNQ